VIIQFLASVLCIIFGAFKRLVGCQEELLAC